MIKHLVLLLMSAVCLQGKAENLPEDTLIGRIYKQYTLFPREKLYTLTDKSTYVPGDTIWMRNFLTDAFTMQEKTGSRYVYAELVSPNDTLMSRVRQAKDDSGAIYGYLVVPRHASEGNYMLKCYSRYMQNFSDNNVFVRPVRIVSVLKKELSEDQVRTGGDYHVSFYPEGGSLISGSLCRVAFKVETASGSASGVHGWILDSKQDTVCRLYTIHQGMGDFSFIPRESETYKAVCMNAYGKKQTFALPEIHSDAYSLKVTRKSHTLYVSYVGGHGTSADSLSLIAVSGDVPVYAANWKSGQENVAFPESLFKGGVVNFYLCKGFHVVSKRSVFVRPRHLPQVCVSVPRDSFFRARTKVTLEVAVKDRSGAPLQGTAAVSVTDAGNILPDSLQNICSELLLSSDIKGVISDPAWYFRTSETQKADYCLDLLMCIHAWCRYDLSSVLRGDYSLPAISPDSSMIIKGKVQTRVNRKPVSEASVKLYPVGGSGVWQSTTDENGKFEFSGFEYPDSTVYVLSAERKKGGINIVLAVDNEPFLQTDGTKSLYKASLLSDNQPVSVSYAEKAIQKVATQDGMRNYYLTDVNVVARKPKEYINEFEVMANVTLKEEDISRSGIMDLRTYIRSRSGVDFYTFRGGTKPPKVGEPNPGKLLVLDEVPIMEAEMIDYILNGGLNKDDIQQIDILKDVACAGYYTGKYELIIAFTTKRGEGGAEYIDTNFGYITPLGLQKPAEFYSPHYAETDMQGIDNRTTIYWNPCLSFSDGKAVVSFYTADVPSDYTVLIEGIASDGNVFSKTTTIDFK